MPLTKVQKQKIIDDLREKIERKNILIFVGISGLKVREISDLRRRLKKVESQLKVTKKTLLRLVFREKGLEIDHKKLEGELALVFGYQDIILPAKTIWQFSADYPNLKILGGIFENKFIETEKIIELAKLPTKEELLARLVGNLARPLLNFIYVLQYNIKGLVYLLSIIKKEQ